MPFVQVNVGTSEALRSLKRVQQQIDSSALNSWKNSTEVALRFMKHNGYIDRTGQLTKSMKLGTIKRAGFLSFRSSVRAEAKYALFVDQPTKPHDIVARRAPLLVFFWGPPNGPGHVVGFRKVKHPGTRGALFSDMTAKHMVGRFQVATQVAIDAAITRSP